MMKKVFDAIVIGAGSGLVISSQAIGLGLKVAIVEKGPFGGTCLNRGCIPSKMLIHSADVIETVRNSALFGINAKVAGISWNSIQKRVWGEVGKEARAIERGNKNIKNVAVYKGSAEFAGKKLIKIGNNLITAKKIFICAGTRPSTPKIKGLDKVEFYTSDDVMKLKKQPKSMIILGGGYISAELGHFFSSLGTNVTLVARSERLLANEDEEVSVAFTKSVSKKYRVLLKANVIEAYQRGGKITLVVEQKGVRKKAAGDVLLIAAGRVPNTDVLRVKKAGVKLDEKGYIKVNSYMETNVPGIWAIGDIAGIYMFKHSANLEAVYCANNAFNPSSKIKVDYSAMPHAIFTSPQIAGVGMTEQELKAKKIKYAVGKYNYIDTGMGSAIEDREGFVKVLVEPKTKQILGCHIIGAHASTLIHEVVVAMKSKLGVKGILNAVHVHPALSEVVQRAFGNVDY